VDPLDIARTQFHLKVQGRIVRQAIEQVECRDLSRGQGWDIRKPTRGIDVIAMLDRRQHTGIETEHGYSKIGFLPRGDFAAAIGLDGFE
jgi:hypothetical protein